jgi:hypothetical protein
LTDGCGALRYHPLYPVDWWYECALEVGHSGNHVALGSDPLVTWARAKDEVFAEPWSLAPDLPDERDHGFMSLPFAASDLPEGT